MYGSHERFCRQRRVSVGTQAYVYRVRCQLESNSKPNSNKYKSPGGNSVANYENFIRTLKKKTDHTVHKKKKIRDIFQRKINKFLLSCKNKLRTR